MKITVWDGDKKKFKGKLRTRTEASATYAKWEGESYLVRNNNEIWLTGSPPNSPNEQSQNNNPDDTPPSSSAQPAPEYSPPTEPPADDFFAGLSPTDGTDVDTPAPLPSEGINWDPSQEAVIQASQDAKLLVSAGPGTGKTAVACKRVAHLIEKHGCNPNRIWLISFTRTAVAEIRARIASHLTSKYDAYSVRIATLDSFAWKINSGFDEEACLDGSFENNIDATIDLVRRDEDVFYHLSKADHLIVDEAQDFIGNRATLVLEIINKLQENAGVTVFADEAQAIYGFSIGDSEADSPDASRTLPQRIRVQNRFEETELTTIHRTSSLGLKSIFQGTRHEVLEESSHTLSKYHNICDQIRNKADFMDDDEFDPLRLPQEDSCFALFRSKKEVLKASSTMKASPHRIRMGNISAGIVPWIGALLSGIDQSHLKSRDFKTLWVEREIEPIAQGADPDSAWKSLKKLGGGIKKPKVDLAKLRKNLANQNLPPELVLPELGMNGPILGTIHAAKGREAEHVYLCLPPNVGGRQADYDEETRVMFVGATRAKSCLHVYKGFKTSFGNRAGEERVWEKAWGQGQGPVARVQIGCPSDIETSAHPLFASVPCAPHPI
ncbi:DNA helicase (fragment) [Pseudodesulfovibrio profundus]|uniref:DNA 3'-5' helicase n=1 Tax=Pseudodesulfovibrio profundus TaxID=57320 RepID=A0A2C8F4N4_9BACT